MKVIILMIIVLLALLMPVLWITGTLTSFVYFWRQRAGRVREEQTVAITPQLGLTMADGGDPVDDKKKGLAAAQAGMTETPPASPERIAPRPVTGKMFWWGGYY